MLEVVDGDQQLALAQIGRQAVGARSVGSGTLGQRRRDLGSDQRRIGQPLQAHEDRAILIIGLVTPGQLHQQPRLANPSGPGQRHQSNVWIAHKPVQHGQLRLPSDQSGRGLRQP